jgi:riboflavin synthase alpha subunit
VFSGIIARIGVLEESRREATGQRLVVRADLGRVPEPGESIAVNGVCLTVERADTARFEAVAVGETLRRTTLGALVPGARLNLEPALRAGDPIGGHWVQGHVDGVGIVRGVERAGSDVRLAIEIPDSLRRFVAVKGSVAVDGVSLTVADWDDPRAVLALVPYTLAHTTASEYAPGRKVNLEVDILARYLDRLLEAREGHAAGVTSGSAPQGRR